MTTSLDRLPFDLIFCITLDLELEDIVHLGQTCRHLRAVLDERTVVRRTVEINYPYTEEANLARRGEITYKQAFQAIYDRRHALSTAHPFSARVLGRGNNFLYRQGTICVFDAGVVHVTNLNSRKEAIRLDLQAIIRPVLESKFRAFGNISVRLLYYADEILSVHAIPKYNSDDSHIFAINTAANLPDGQRVIESVRLIECSKLFVRHNKHYLYYGTHTGIGDDGHHKWEIEGISLHGDFRITERERPVLLDKFHGSDIGSTIAFEIHNNYFYAVSNQGTFEVEEIDYTSFYHVVRFPLDKPDDVQKDERLFRRQHKQGPIHDSWTDLALQLDERTNETVIVESRREWAQASSRQSRTFYVTKMDFQEEDDTDEPSDELLGPEDDLFLPLIDSSNNPQWKPTPDLYSWSQHPEFSPTDPSPRSFTLSRTKFRAYSYPCTSFVDLVEDDRCCDNPSQAPCLRLRIGSRRELGLSFTSTSSSSSSSNSKGKAPIDDTKPSFVDTQTLYRQSPIHMWPPPSSRCACSARLHNILNPTLPTTNTSSSTTRSVTGVLDSQRLVFMIKPGRSYGSSEDNTSGSIVVIDFTRPLTATGPTPSASSSSSLALRPSSLARCDSKMGDELVTPKRCVDPFVWHWSDDSKGRCRRGTCQ